SGCWDWLGTVSGFFSRGTWSGSCDARIPLGACPGALKPRVKKTTENASLFKRPTHLGSETAFGRNSLARQRKCTANEWSSRRQGVETRGSDSRNENLRFRTACSREPHLAV